jgi:hypothetical protein
MALGSTQPLTEMSTRNLPGRKERPVRKADNLTAICETSLYKIWRPRRLTTLWASKLVTGSVLPNSNRCSSCKSLFFPPNIDISHLLPFIDINFVLIHFESISSTVEVSMQSIRSRPKFEGGAEEKMDLADRCIANDVL